MSTLRSVVVNHEVLQPTPMWIMEHSGMDKICRNFLTKKSNIIMINYFAEDSNLLYNS